MKSKRLISVLLAILVGCVAIGLSFTALWERFDMGALNYWFLLRGKGAPPQDIAIIAMDELSYRDLNVPLSQAWPRRLHAALIERLAELGAKRAVFDVLFLDPGSDPEGDKALAHALTKLPVYLGAESAVQNIAGAGGAFSIEELLEPYEPFSRAAAGLALVSLPEHDGAVRKFLTARSERTADLPSLAEAGAGFAPSDSKTRPGPRDLINYYGPARTIPTLSYYQVLQKERPIPESLIKDKVVYIGLALRTDTGPAQKDIFETSYGGLRIFGVEIHATAAANLMKGDWIKRFSSVTETAVEVALATAVGYSIVSSGPIVGGIVVAGALIAWCAASIALFFGGIFLPGALLVIVLLPALYLMTTIYYYLVVRRSAKQMQNAFELYLSPETARQLSQGDSAAALGGTKLWATALFTDIQDFTKITESMPAEKVAEMLNAYFTEVMEVVFQNKGTLIKFIGDAVFVLWGAPVRIDNHAELAVRTGIALGKEVERFNQSGRFPALHTRVGINTGPMVVGNLGSKRRFDYTAIGDSVNLASRVEGLNKYLGTTLLFTESTRKDAGDTITAVKVGQVRVAGKSESVWLYTTFDPPPASNVGNAFNQFLEDFRLRKWPESLAVLNEIEAREPQLGRVCLLYKGIIESYMQAPPAPGWAGELEFSHK